MIHERLSKLRTLMAEYKIQAYIIPGTDPHQSEYLPELWQRRQFITGFTGSAGEIIVTMDKAGLWTDSRYFLQGEQQLKDTGFTLFKMGLPETPDILCWLRDELNEGECVGIDTKVASLPFYSQIANTLKEKSIGITAIEKNLVDEIWDDQPSMPMGKIMHLSEEFSGESSESKIERVRKSFDSLFVDAHILSALDAIAWLYNIRGTDVEYNPVVISYAVIDKEKAHLFVKKEKLTDDVLKKLNHVDIHDYEEFKSFLETLNNRQASVLLDKGTVSQWIVDNLHDCRLVLGTSPVTMMKSMKNDTELEGFRNAHIRDGVAMVKFLKWLPDAVERGGVTEISAVDRLLEFRAEQKLFQGASFGTISGYKEHGAIVHYSSTPETDVELKKDGIFLIDSGGQYLDGTTDITRTVTLGNPTDEQKEMFTRVLMGHLDLGRISFPKGTSGKQLDTIARKPLWDAGLNFGHGVGHGVGHFLNVHEGPQAISYYRCTGVPMELGMVTSNEPGFYKAGEYGIRLETLVAVIKDEKKSSSEFEFYSFETLTLCPIDKKLINKEIMSDEQISALNDYHKTVYNNLSPHLNEEETLWLKEATSEI